MNKHLLTSVSATFLLATCVFADKAYDKAMAQGEAKYRTEEYEEARSHFEKALDIAFEEEHQGRAHFMIGRTFLAEESFAEAKQSFEHVLKLEDADPEDRKSAQHLVHKSIRGEYALFVRTKGVTLLKTKGHPFQRSRELFENAYEHYLDRDFRKARVLFRKATEVKDGHAHYSALAHFLIGYTHYSEGGHAKAREAFGKVGEFVCVPERYLSDAERYIARCHLHEGQRDAARSAYRKVIALDGYPTHVEEATAAMEQLVAAPKETTVPFGRESMLEEAEAQRKIVLKRMAQEGLSPENCYLKAVKVYGAHQELSPYPKAGLPRAWNFDDGTRCGISEAGPGITNLRVEDGKLRFWTGAVAHLSYFEWDQLDGEPGEKADASDHGEDSSFGEDSVALRLNVRSPDDDSFLPRPGAEMIAPGGEEDEEGAQPAPGTVGALIGDADIEGIAVHSLSCPDGKWIYSTDAGRTWKDTGAVDARNALLLRATDMIYPVAKDGDIESAFFGWGNFDLMSPSLQFGYGSGKGDDCPPMRGVRIRLRQSLQRSKWQILYKSVRRGRVTVNETEDFLVKGRDWQTVTFETESTRPPYPAFRVIAKTPGNDVEIDWIQPCVDNGPTWCRKNLSLPAGVRWARCSVSAFGRFRLHVNGVEAAVSPPRVHYEQLWNYELDPGLFRKGGSVIAYEGDPRFMLDGALLCDDGSYLRFDSDGSWKTSAPSEGKGWLKPGYDDADWRPVTVLHEYFGYAGYLRPEQEYQKFWFNPSYKGPIAVAPADGRSQAVYGSKEGISLRVAVPLRQGEAQEVAWQLFDEMGDGFHAQDKLVKDGVLSLRQQDKDNVGRLDFSPGELRANAAYAVVLTFRADDREIEKRRYEIAVCGPVEQLVIDSPKGYTDGMKLKLVWEVDAAAEQKPGEFIATDGLKRFVETSVVETPLGKFRQMKEGHRYHFMSFKYRIEDPGRPHLAISEYPADTKRIQEMRLTEGSILGHTTSAMTELGNDTAVLGAVAPLSHKLRQLHVVFFPNNKVGAVSIVGPGTRVGKIRIYEILNDIPMRRITDAPGRPKWFGQLSERGPYQVMQSCLASPIAPVVRRHLILSDTPNFYRHWMVTTTNMIRRLRFAGENAYFIGQYMYHSPLFPSRYSYVTNFVGPYGGSLRDAGTLMARMFEENGLGLFTGLEMAAHDAVTPMGDSDQIAQGAEARTQVDKHGHQHLFLGRTFPYPNWIHPEVRGHFEGIINELLALYGKEEGWKGIVLQVNEALGPTWLCRGGDPYFASYDDYTISAFQEDVGIRLLGEHKDFRRFPSRYDWLMAKAKREWTDWRCRKTTEIYEWVRDRLKATRDDLQLVFYSQAGTYNIPHATPDGLKNLPIYESARRGGLDVERLKNDPDINFVISVSGNKFTSDIWKHVARTDDYFDYYANDGINGIAVRNMWYETQTYATEGWVFYYTSPEAWPHRPDEYLCDVFTNVFIRSNPTLILHPLQDVLMWMGREVGLSRFAAAFRSLPAAKYRRLAGNGRDKNVWIQVARYGNDLYGYIANPQWWELYTKVTFTDGLKPHDLIPDAALPAPEWRLRLAPFAIHTFKVENAGTDEPISACTAQVSGEGRDCTQKLLEQIKKQFQSVAKALDNAGDRAEVEELLGAAKGAIEVGDFSRAHDLLTVSPALLRLQKAAEAPGKAEAPAHESPFKATAETYSVGARHFLKKKDYEHALGLYLRSWVLLLKDEEPKTVGDIEARIGECLVGLGRQGKFNEWRNWTRVGPGERGRCPILGIGKVPEDWKERWDTRPDRIVRDTISAVHRYGITLCEAGRIREAKAAFERVLFLARKSGSSRERRDLPGKVEYLLKYCRRWSKRRPESLP